MCAIGQERNSTQAQELAILHIGLIARSHCLEARNQLASHQHDHRKTVAPSGSSCYGDLGRIFSAQTALLQACSFDRAVWALLPRRGSDVRSGSSQFDTASSLTPGHCSALPLFLGACSSDNVARTPLPRRAVVNSTTAYTSTCGNWRARRIQSWRRAALSV